MLYNKDSMNSKQFKKQLAKLGATFEQGKGSHLKVTLNGQRSVLPMHNTDLPKGTLHAIKKQLRIK